GSRKSSGVAPCATGRITSSLLGGLGERQVVLPAFVLQLDVLERDGVPARIQVRQCLVFRHPAPMDDIPMHRLSFLVQQLDPDLLPEILEGLRRYALVQ